MDTLMKNDRAVREQLSRLLSWEDSHVGFDAAVADIPVKARGTKPKGLPYSPWQIMEHIRRAQADILDFCRNPNYKEKNWPADYWPSDPVPPSAAAWTQSI